MRTKPILADQQDRLAKLRELRMRSADLEIQRANILLALKENNKQLDDTHEAIAIEIKNLELDQVQATSGRYATGPSRLSVIAEEMDLNDRMNAYARIHRVLLESPGWVSRKEVIRQLPEIPVKTIDGSLSRLRREGAIETVEGMRGNYRTTASRPVQNQVGPVPPARTSPEEE